MQVYCLPAAHRVKLERLVGVAGGHRGVGLIAEQPKTPARLKHQVPLLPPDTTTTTKPETDHVRWCNWLVWARLSSALFLSLPPRPPACLPAGSLGPEELAALLEHVALLPLGRGPGGRGAQRLLVQDHRGRRRASRRRRRQLQHAGTYTRGQPSQKGPASIQPRRAASPHMPQLPVQGPSAMAA